MPNGETLSSRKEIKSSWFLLDESDNGLSCLSIGTELKATVHALSASEAQSAESGRLQTCQLDGLNCRGGTPWPSYSPRIR